MLYVGIATIIMAMGVTWVATPLVIRLAGRLGALDLPGGRKTHAEPIPRIGGLAVFVGFVSALGFAALLTGNLLTVQQVDVYWRALAIAATLILIVGLIDDLWGIGFAWKFAAQLLTASFVWYFGFRIDVLSHPLGGTIELGMLSFPITVLWIVGISNAVNLIDGLDGLAAGIALITTLAVAVIALARRELGVTAASVALAGSLIGFLRFNFNPARIFLGDSGSLFLGFVLAVTSVRGSQKGATAVAILAPLLILGLPLLDTGLAIVRRLYRLTRHGRSSESTMRYIVSNLHHVFLPDRGHIHHRLLDLGLSHRGAVLMLYVVGGLFAAAAFALVLFRSVTIGLLLLGVLAVKIGVFILLLYFRIWRLEREPESCDPQEAKAREISAPSMPKTWRPSSGPARSR